MPLLRTLSMLRRSAVALGLAVLPAVAVAQQDGSALATRASLREELVRLARDGHAQGAAALIRSRLESGDFQVGDRLVLVDGQVTRPGFYAAAPEQPLADVITLAGGLTQQAKPADMRVERGQATIISGPRLQEALGRGYSLDRLNLRAGDRVFVPTRGDPERTLRIVGLLLSVPVAVFAISRVF